MLYCAGIHAERFVLYRKVSHRIFGQQVRLDGIDLCLGSALQGCKLGRRQLRKHGEGVLAGSIRYSKLRESRSRILLKIGYYRESMGKNRIEGCNFLFIGGIYFVNIFIRQLRIGFHIFGIIGSGKGLLIK